MIKKLMINRKNIIKLGRNDNWKIYFGGNVKDVIRKISLLWFIGFLGDVFYTKSEISMPFAFGLNIVITIGISFMYEVIGTLVETNNFVRSVKNSFQVFADAYTHYEIIWAIAGVLMILCVFVISNVPFSLYTQQMTVSNLVVQCIAFGLVFVILNFCFLLPNSFARMMVGGLIAMLSCVFLMIYTSSHQFPVWVYICAAISVVIMYFVSRKVFLQVMEKRWKKISW